MSSTVEAPPKKQSKKDYDAGIDVRWCPGCGDYAILAGVQRALPTFGIPREKFVFVSGIGCSSRFPYYMNTFGFHTIHGRAPAVATGIAIHRPDLHVWMITGDGDALSIGGNHFIHALRRNMNIKMLLFNNRIYGLTKGQYSPTSETGKKTKTSPMGSIDHPFTPLSIALGAEATFVARCVDTDTKLMQEVLGAAQQHKGAALVEMFQNCNIFNDGAFIHFADRKVKEDRQLVLRHDQPMIFGKEKNRGVIMKDGRLQITTIGENGITMSDILVHNAHDPDPSIAFWLSRFEGPDFPVAVGVLRDVDRPVYNVVLQEQITLAQEQKGTGDLKSLLHSGDTWTIG